MRPKHLVHLPEGRLSRWHREEAQGSDFCHPSSSCDRSEPKPKTYKLLLHVEELTIPNPLESLVSTPVLHISRPPNPQRKNSSAIQSEAKSTRPVIPRGKHRRQHPQGIYLAQLEDRRRRPTLSKPRHPNPKVRANPVEAGRRSRCRKSMSKIDVEVEVEGEGRGEVEDPMRRKEIRTGAGGGRLYFILS